MEERFKLYYKLLDQDQLLIEAYDSLEEAEFALKNNIRFMSLYGQVLVNGVIIHKKNIEKLWIYDELGTYNY